MARTAATHCLRGHDIAVVGRSKQRMCRACLRAWDNERNQRRRQDPTYCSTENHRQWKARYVTRTAKKEELIAALENYVLTEWPDLAQIMGITPRRKHA